MKIWQFGFLVSVLGGGFLYPAAALSSSGVITVSNHCKKTVYVSMQRLGRFSCHIHFSRQHKLKPKKSHTFEKDVDSKCNYRISVGDSMTWPFPYESFKVDLHDKHARKAVGTLVGKDCKTLDVWYEK